VCWIFWRGTGEGAGIAGRLTVWHDVSASDNKINRPRTCHFWIWDRLISVLFLFNIKLVGSVMRTICRLREYYLMIYCFAADNSKKTKNSQKMPPALKWPCIDAIRCLRLSPRHPRSAHDW